MKARRLRCKSWLIAALLLLAGGCGDPLGRLPVSGSITLKGKPLTGGLISLQPIDGSVSSGSMVKDGTFNIPQDKGLPPGKYRVRISAPDLSKKAQSSVSGTLLPAEDLIPPEWNSESKHDIEVTEDGENNFPFVIP